MIKKIFVLLVTAFVLGCGAPKTQNSQAHFPGTDWEVVEKPELLGLSSERMAIAKAFADTALQTAAVMVVIDGKVAYEWGETARKFNTHSIRKSFMSAMYGKYVRDGSINLDASMADLGINDVGGLTEEELTATVRDLLKARSGIYHDAHYETPAMKSSKPTRSSLKPGTFWYYNNWDFNALNTIFKQQTNKDFYEAIQTDIADPIGMQDYSPSDGYYFSGPESVHDAYPFDVTARDLARFGWLMLNHGNWNGKQVIDSAWVQESVQYHSDATYSNTSGYSYLWWVARDFNKHPHFNNVEVPDGSYSARGAGGHVVMVIPAYNMVVVHRVNTDPGVRNRVSYPDFGKLLDLILKARIEK